MQSSPAKSPVETREVICSHCGHVQQTKSRSLMITCSSCQKKTKNAGV